MFEAAGSLPTPHKWRDDGNQTCQVLETWQVFGGMMTKEDWAKVEKALGGTYGFAKLTVDGRAVTFKRSLISKNKLGIVTYVDGQWKGEWISPKEQHPEQKFLRRMERFKWSPNQRSELRKWPKSLLKKTGYHPDEKVHCFYPIWTNATAIRRHYQKTFASIELVEVCG